MFAAKMIELDEKLRHLHERCLLYTSDAADEEDV